jgi:Na+-translocating ferredoxin:NAD+ oxidoreductase subunit A
MSLINLFIASILTQNIVLTKFLGICPFVGTSDNEKNALGMGLAVMLVVTISSLITYGLYHLVLIPSNTEYLKTIIFILVIASCVQILDILMKNFIPKLHKSLGIYLPLITTNCAVLGIVLLNVNNNYSFSEMLVYSIGSSLGFTMVIYLFASMRERLNNKKILQSLRGFPIALIIAGIMALLFTRYNIQ